MLCSGLGLVWSAPTTLDSACGSLQCDNDDEEEERNTFDNAAACLV